MPKAAPHCRLKSGLAGKGAAHAGYIGGVGKHAERDDVVAVVDKNIPVWAKDGVDFFDAADQLERAGGRAYTEIEAAIPRGVADPVAYAAKYAEQLLGDRHPYRLAVHDKLAGDGGRNVHMHLMFSDRTLDGIERDRDRFFKRAAAPYRHRVTKEMMPADPSKGGAAKDRTWNARGQVQVVRDGWEAHAKAHGFDLDLRSNAAKGLAAPEPKLGPAHPRAVADPAREVRQVEVERLREIRSIHAKLDALDELAEAAMAADRAAAALDAIERQAAAERKAAQEAQRAQRAAEVAERKAAQEAVEAAQRAAKAAQAMRDAQQAAKAVEASQKAAQAQRAATERATRPERWRRRVAGLQNTVHSTVFDRAGHERKVYAWAQGPSAGRAAFVDHGYALVAAGKPTGAKVRAMAELAQQKWPDGVILTGNAEWKALALPQMLAKGVIVKNPELQAHVQAWHEAAAERAVQSAKLDKMIDDRLAGKSAYAVGNPRSAYHPDNVARRAAAEAERARAEREAKIYVRTPEQQALWDKRMAASEAKTAAKAKAEQEAVAKVEAEARAQAEAKAAALAPTPARPVALPTLPTLGPRPPIPGKGKGGHGR